MNLYLSRVPPRNRQLGLPVVELYVPDAWVVVHNHLRPTRSLRTTAFRAWISPKDASYIRCSCAWAPQLRKHYRVKGPYSRLPSR